MDLGSIRQLYGVSTAVSNCINMGLKKISDAPLLEITSLLCSLQKSVVSTLYKARHTIVYFQRNPFLCL